MVPLTATGPRVYVATIKTAISDSWNNLEYNINNLNSIKLKSYLGDNDTYLCAKILVDDEQLGSDGELNPDHLGYIDHIF